MIPKSWKNNSNCDIWDVCFNCVFFDDCFDKGSFVFVEDDSLGSCNKFLLDLSKDEKK